MNSPEPPSDQRSEHFDSTFVAREIQSLAQITPFAALLRALKWLEEHGRSHYLHYQSTGQIENLNEA